MEDMNSPDKSYSYDHIDTINPNYSFYSTLCTVAAAVISIICAFIFAHIIYIDQRRNDLTIIVIKQLQSLNKMIDDLSQIERTPSSPWIKEPSERYISIMQKETWDKSPAGIFKSNIDNIIIKYHDTYKEFRRNIPEGAALSEVKSDLNNLCEIIYLEFPSPPGKIKSEGNNIYYDAFIDDDFPNVKNKFEVWENKYTKYYDEINKIFSFDLSFVIWEIKRVAKLDVNRIRKKLELREKSGIPLYRTMPDIESIIIEDSRYYDKLVLYMSKIRDQALLIKKEMKYYDNYVEKRPSLLNWILLFISMIFGIIIPLILLSSIKKPQYIRDNILFMEIVTIVGFIVPLITSLLLLIKNYYI